MFLYGEQLKNEVSYILDKSEPSLFFINAYLTTSGSSTPLDVDINPIDTITIVQNFDSNYADIVMLQTRLLVKDILYILDHYKDLHCSIQFKPDTGNALEDGLQEINIEDYKVVINNADDIRKNINMNQFVNTNEEGDNGYTNKEQYYGQRIPITLELFSETLYDLRHITVATKLSNCTMEQAILYLANAYGIKSTIITPPDNTKVYRDIPIPPKVGGIEKSLTYLQKKFGIIQGVTDKNYITNSYHIHVTEEIDAFSKLAFESKFQELSPGGAISYVEVPNMNNNIPAVLDVMKFIYDNIMYAELNTKSDYCQNCGFDGEILIVRDGDSKLVWECPKCGNRDQSKLNVARRTCGYIGSQFWNQGRTQEIKERVLHL